MIEQLKNLLGEENVIENEPMSKHTTFHVGGNAKYFVYAKNEDALISVLNFCKEKQITYYILGNGSNLIVRDEGYDGMMIKLDGVFRQVDYCEKEEKTISLRAVNPILVGALAKHPDKEQELMQKQAGNTFSGVVAGGGAILANVSMAAANAGLTGLEFAFGIPGSVGGAMVMNAGAYGGEMKQVVKSLRVLMENESTGKWEVKELSGEDMAFGYRDSLLKHKKGIVLWVTFALTSGNKEEIKAQMDELTRQRKEKQPLEYPSAGSTFKRPEGYFAGKLIQDAGLKGYRVGGAMVSEKHAGFVVNVDHASAQDVLQVIEDVSRIVKEKTGVTLEPEVIIL